MPHLRSSVSALTQSIDRDRRDNDSTDDDFLNGVVDSRQRAASTQATEHECADHRAEDSTFAAREARATNHHRSDNLQFKANRGRWIADPEPAKRDGARESGAQTA